MLFFGHQLRAQAISGTVNNYAEVTALAGTNITVVSAAGFSVGDRILIIQMKGATINTTNTANFGDITNYGNAGNYEFADISADVWTFEKLIEACRYHPHDAVERCHVCIQRLLRAISLYSGFIQKTMRGSVESEGQGDMSIGFGGKDTDRVSE